jgi:hypothetical protein
MTNIAFNYIPFINIEALTVKRKGKVIKGETEAAIAAARKERQSMKNAAKRLRRQRRLH